MKITILTAGTRGDVQPFVALGVELKKRGYEVCMPAPEVFRDLILEHGLQFVRTRSIDPQEFMKSLDFQKATKDKNKLRFVAKVFREIKPMMEGALMEAWEASQGSDAIISTLGFFGAYDIAEKLNIPCIFSLLAPVHTTSAFPSPMAPDFFNLGIYNKMTHRLTEQLIWQPFRGIFRHWRKDILGLEPHSFWGPFKKIYQRTAPFLFGYSPALIPKPKDWPGCIHVTGYWFLEEPTDWLPPVELEAFLKAGSPPVYIGFGSMADKNSERMTQIALDALKISGQRGILSSGWSGLGSKELPDTVLQVGSIPHAWLFQKVAAIVHHGGAGTTAAAIRSGNPSIVVPFVADQPFWGQCAFKKGVGTEAVSYSKITAEKLAELIKRAVSDKCIRAKAKSLGAHIESEKGAAKAAELIQRYINIQ